MGEDTMSDREEPAPAEIQETTEENDRGFDQECVYAVCSVSGDEVGPVWGTGEASRKRALATLTEECSCGAKFHEEE
jgi:hypothetical protein